MTPTSRYFSTGGLSIHVTEWGNPDCPALVMWHGLARTGRDFDEVASVLSRRYFVLCPDTPGRGLSGWSNNPEQDYCYLRYSQIAAAMLDTYKIERARWVGTSMGGMIGVASAAGPLRTRISHLVINDIGPQVPKPALERIIGYVGNPPVVDTIPELETWLRTSYAPFGENSSQFWRRLAETSYRRKNDGRITVHHDAAIVCQFTAHREDLDLWQAYDSLELPVLLLRGSQSDLLTVAMADRMCRRGPIPRLEVIDGRGHAPTLTSDKEIEMIEKFLSQGVAADC